MEEQGGGENTYEGDLHAWALRQAELLRAGQFEDLDVENVAEEIESLGRSQPSALQSSYRLIAIHLLKVLFQPERLTRSWTVTILRERLNAQDCLGENPSLKPRRAELFKAAYRQARKLAAAETELALRTFPVEPPFTLEEASSEDYAPWAAAGGADRGPSTEG